MGLRCFFEVAEFAARHIDGYFESWLAWVNRVFYELKSSRFYEPVTKCLIFTMIHNAFHATSSEENTVAPIDDLVVGRVVLYFLVCLKYMAASSYIPVLA
jgi:hypothetical protein